MVKKTMEELWDSTPKKLFLWIKSGKDLPSKDKNGLSDPYVEVKYGKKKVKSTEIKYKTLNPVYSDAEMFFIKDDGSDLTLEVRDKDKIGSDFMGVIPLGKLDLFLPLETVYERTFPLEKRPDKPKDSVSGTLTVMFYYSASKSIRPSGFNRSENTVIFDNIAPFLKTGDLIAYEGIGLLDSLQKLTSRSDISRLGLVVRLPNLYTLKTESYIFELTKNCENFLDVYKETPFQGACLFRAEERIHQVNAVKVHYAPLSRPLDEKKEGEILTAVVNLLKQQTYVKSANLEGKKLLETERAGVVAGLLRANKKSDFIEQDLYEFFSADCISFLFTLAGMNLFADSGNKKVFSPIDVMKCGSFADHQTIRFNAGTIPVNPAPSIRNSQPANGNNNLRTSQPPEPTTNSPSTSYKNLNQSGTNYTLPPTSPPPPYAAPLTTSGQYNLSNSQNGTPVQLRTSASGATPTAPGSQSPATAPPPAYTPPYSSPPPVSTNAHILDQLRDVSSPSMNDNRKLSEEKSFYQISPH